MSLARPRYLLLGEILRPHGVRGELRLRILTDYPERIAQLETVYIGTDVDAPDLEPYQVEAMRMHQEYGLLKLRNVNDRDQAELLRELMVMVDIDHAVPLDEGEFYLFELLGLLVQTVSGETLGSIVDVLETGANDVYIIDSPRYGELLIPATDETIIETRPADGLVIVKLPEGLLPET